MKLSCDKCSSIFEITELETRPLEGDLHEHGFARPNGHWHRTSLSNAEVRAVEAERVALEATLRELRAAGGNRQAIAKVEYRVKKLREKQGRLVTALMKKRR